MRRSRFLAPWKDSGEKPAIYHCISRVVDRQFFLGDTEREQFRIFMRMYENFSGIRVLSYCVMSNHVHLLLEVPPMPVGGLSDEELLRRLRAIYSEERVREVALELKDARKKGLDAWAQGIHERFTYRMHDLSQYMKTVMQRMTQWFNGQRKRTGTLWESRFKSVIVECGAAARTMAAYIDLNPVRAGMVKDPAEYRWSSYGEAVGGGAKGNGKKAREGLVRACMGDVGVGFDAERWREVSFMYRKAMGLELERKAGRAKEYVEGVRKKKLAVMVKKSMQRTDQSGAEVAAARERENETVLAEMKTAEMLMHRVRYFSDGAVIGSKAFVNEVFVRARERFSEGRKDGARKVRGGAEGVLWSARELSG